MNACNDNWIDLYEVLGVEGDVDEKTLQSTLRKYGSRKNDDVPSQLVAQCRLILLDADYRARYNRVRAQHRVHSSAAMDYPTFVSMIQRDEARRQLMVAAEPLPVAAPAMTAPAVAARHTRALSPNTVYLLTGVVATMLMNFIQSGTSVLPGV